MTNRCRPASLARSTIVGPSREPDERHGKVFVAPVDATRGMSFDAVFVPGLAEKMFPRKIVEEPILLDSVRERIGDLATNPARLEEERLALALVAGAAEQRFGPPRVSCRTSPSSRDAFSHAFTHPPVPWQNARPIPYLERALSLRKLHDLRRHRKLYQMQVHGLR